MPNVKEAVTFIKKDGEDIYVIGKVELERQSELPDQLRFLDDKDIGATIERVFGCGTGNTRTFLYHAPTMSDATKIIRALADGPGYTINGAQVPFEAVNANASLESLANDIISQYHSGHPGDDNQPFFI